MRPDHLVLDEPFTGLDAPAREDLLARLGELHAGGTGIVVVTHDLRELLEPAQRVVCLANGRVVADAEPEAAVSKLKQYGVRVPGTAD
jgi:biotin transport system ATP-binding protein